METRDIKMIDLKNITADAKCQTSDVIVCGAGPAGVMAAIAAARAGAKVQLIEAAGCLGGVWTSGLLSWLLDVCDKPGLMAELIERLEKQRAIMDWNHRDHHLLEHITPDQGLAYDAEVMKWVLDQMCEESGVMVRCYTRVADVVMQDETICGVSTYSESGLEFFMADVVIDASGSGYVGAMAGNAFEFGSAKGETQPMTMMCLLAGLDMEALSDYHRFRKDGNGSRGAAWNTEKVRLHDLLKAHGLETSYSNVTLFLMPSGTVTMMANHEYGLNGLDAADLTVASQRARHELQQVVATLKGLGGAWSDLQLVATSSHIGVREGRRLAGLYELSQADLKNGRRFDDGICRVNFGIDVHSPNPKQGKGIPKFVSWGAQPYDIPLRSLIARDVKGLMMAGRCISGDFLAHSSYRVTGNAVAMGQAAGCAAAVCSKHHLAPQALSFEMVQACLEQTFDMSGVELSPS